MPTLNDQPTSDFQALTRLPERMAPWHMRLEFPYSSSYGQYILLAAEPASIEQHHQVTVVDEGGDPLPGVWVIFGYPGSQGPLIPLEPKENYWTGSPIQLVGNAQRTNMMGYAQHTLGSGGEDIFVWDLEASDVLKMSSVIVRNCTWISAASGGPFNHSGVHLTFQRRRIGVPTVSRRKRVDAMEATMAHLEADMDDLAKSSDELRMEVETTLRQQAAQIENYRLRVELLEERFKSFSAGR